MRYVLAFLVLAGCDGVFNLEPVSSPQPPVDAMLIDERPDFCGAPALFDAFNGSIACGFGAATRPGSLSQHDGVFDVMIDGTAAQFAGCTAFQPLPFTDNGVFVHIVEPLHVANSYTSLKLRETYQTLPAMSATILARPDKLELYVNDVLYNEHALGPTWWRLRVPTGTTTVTAELSDDGITWEPFGAHDAPQPPSIAIDLGAGISAPTTAGTATFSAIGVCN